MNPRERTIALVVGCLLAVGVGYSSIKWVYLDPMRDGRARIQTLEKAKSDLTAEVERKGELIRQWKHFAGRTFSLEPDKAINRFESEMKRLAEKHHLDNANFSPRVRGDPVGIKTGIRSVACGITAEGRYSDVVSFLRELNHSPYLCQVSKLVIAPIDPRIAPDRVKIEQMLVQSPVLPEIKQQELKGLSGVPTLESDEIDTLPPVRTALASDERYQVLGRRNIFRPYIPPPENVVTIDNKDRATVLVYIKSFWEDRPTSQPPLVVKPSAKHQSPKIKGDVLEVTALYEDGEKFGPTRFDAKSRQPWIFDVPSHTPEPPPTVVELEVDNQSDSAALVSITLMRKDAVPEQLPTMYFEPGKTAAAGRYPCVSLRVGAVYEKSKRAIPERTIKPGKEKVTFLVPPDVEPVVAAAPPPAPQEVQDGEPDAKLFVAATLIYRGQQELIASDGNERKIIARGAPVDDGELFAVHPLGALVFMPRTNRFYLYPHERKFTDRVLLDVSSPEDLPGAIDRWVAADAVELPELESLPPLPTSAPPSEAGPSVSSTSPEAVAVPSQPVDQPPRPGRFNRRMMRKGEQIPGKPPDNTGQ